MEVSAYRVYIQEALYMKIVFAKEKLQSLLKIIKELGLKEWNHWHMITTYVRNSEMRLIKI